MRNCQFTIRKAGIFCPGKEIKGLRGGVRPYAAQASLKIDTARAEKHPFRTETKKALSEEAACHGLFARSAEYCFIY